MLTLDKMQSASAVPTDPSHTDAPPLVTARKKVAVPLAAASLSETTVFAVATPLTAAAKAGFAKVGDARSTCGVMAVSAELGRAPSSKRTLPPLSKAQRASAAVLGLAALRVITISAVLETLQRL